ncbi:MAG TPA: hypothetical protein EYH30_02405 [Anaerolineales bacterium]|nr:hypothetical protein [Anaerolineae bacterium]HIQ00974.1 hypothetical protein [Anaerolineales bacterium]
MNQRGSGLFNMLSLVLVGLTGITLICYLVVLVYPTVFFNPFPPGREIGLVSPTPTPTPALPPTYTPTNTPTITPTWPPTPTPTPRATRSPYPFTCEVEYRRPEYDSWSGVAGHIQDLDGNPLPGYHVKTEGAGLSPPAVRAGADSRINTIYGSDAAWEQAYNPGAYQAMGIRVQLFNDHPDPDGSYRAVSDVLTVNLPGYASGSLGYVVCTLNWEDWR